MGGVETGLLRELANDLDTPGVARFLVAMPNTPSRVLDNIIRQGDIECLRILAANPAYQERLSNHENQEVRQVVAGCRNLPFSVALQLCADPAFQVRMTLAKNPSIPPKIQLKLSSDPVPFVRMALLENRKLDEEFQVGLGDDIDTTVHLSTLLMPRLSYVCMKIWSEFDEELGQLALARRQDLPPNIQETLSKSKYPSVLQELLKYQKLSDETLVTFASSGDEATLLALLEQPELSVTVQLRSWKWGEATPAVKQKLAQNPSLADEVGVMMVGDGADSGLLELLAQNPSANLTATRKLLAESGQPRVLKLLAGHPAVKESNELLSAIIENAGDDVLPHVAYRRLNCSGVSEAARQRLLNSQLHSVRNLVAVN